MKKFIFPILLFILFIPYYVNAEKCDSDKIVISKITVEEKSDSVEELNQATANGKSIFLNLSMSKVGDSIKYKVVVKNDSDEDYKLDKNSFQINSEYIDYTLELENQSNIVKAKSIQTVYLNVEYKNELPNDQFESGTYNDNKTVTLNFTTGDSINLLDTLRNPKTGSHSYFFILLFLLVISVFLKVLLKKKRYHKTMVLIIGMGIVVPISVCALCKVEVKIESNIIIRNTGTKATAYINNLINGEDQTSTNVIQATDVSNICTNTLAFDGTSDNNLRYVGINPCNYVKFNEEEINTITGWMETSIDENVEYGTLFSTQEECENYIVEEDLTEYETCKKRTIATSGWRIIGVMNNIDDGTGKKETRLKLIRATSLGDFSFDSSDTSINSGRGTNDWTHSHLKDELNGDYLNTTLNSNVYWFNNYNNTKEGIYNYNKGIKAKYQNMIDNAVWNLGAAEWSINNNSLVVPKKVYESERNTKVWGSESSQECSDYACPRANKWTGKVALMYASDYGFAVGGSVRSSCLDMSILYHNNECGLNNWLKPTNTTNQWTNSYRTLTGVSVYPDWNYVIYSYGTATYEITSYSMEILPVIYLKADVLITGGDGSAENPYELSM